VWRLPDSEKRSCTIASLLRVARCHSPKVVEVALQPEEDRESRGPRRIQSLERTELLWCENRRPRALPGYARSHSSGHYELKYPPRGYTVGVQFAEPNPPSRTLGWLLALPLGFVIAFVIFVLLATSGHYFFGEYVVIFLAVFAIVFLVSFQYRQSRRNYWKARMQANAPARILRQRYARGEISREQFQQMMRDLREGRQPSQDQQQT